MGKIFCGKMLDDGVEKAHKAVRANELARPKGRREKKFSRMAKKVLDAGLKMRHKSLAPTSCPDGAAKKLSRNEKKLVDSENEAA